MTKHLFLSALALLLILPLLSACAAPQGDSDVPTDATEPTVAGVAETENIHPALREAADAALMEAFPALREVGTTPFRIEHSQHVAKTERHTVRYQLYLEGMHTYESYTVTLIEQDGGYAVDKTYAANEGDYLRFFRRCTPEAVERAKGEILEQIGSVEDSSGYYLGINDNGHLVLTVEKIVDIPTLLPTEGGCGIDHEHKFYTAVICE